jgi:hypothetical protein
MTVVIPMSNRELSRLRVLVELADGWLTVAVAAALIGLGRRQVFRLRQALAAAGPSGLVSKKSAAGRATAAMVGPSGKRC